MSFPPGLVDIADSRIIAVIAWNINLIRNMGINNNIYYCLLGISPTNRHFSWMVARRRKMFSVAPTPNEEEVNDDDHDT